MNDSNRPLIGITSYATQAQFAVWDTPSAVLHWDYVQSVAASGGAPVLLPPIPDAALAVVEPLDGLVLAGGPDIEPRRFGQPAHATTIAQPSRDEFEFRVLEHALRREIPILAVCRGLQVLNVHRGGTIAQHLPESLGGTQHQPARAQFGEQTVKVVERTRLAALVGRSLPVRCYHHQAIDQLGEGLIVTARTEDGSIEAIELTDHPFCVGVQWHPETNSTDRRLFEALVANAGDAAASRSRKAGRTHE